MMTFIEIDITKRDEERMREKKEEREESMREKKV